MERKVTEACGKFATPHDIFLDFFNGHLDEIKIFCTYSRRPVLSYYIVSKECFLL